MKKSEKKNPSPIIATVDGQKYTNKLKFLWLKLQTIIKVFFGEWQQNQPLPPDNTKIKYKI